MNHITLADLKTELKNLVQSMINERVIDDQFSQIQALQDSSNPNFVVEVITLFCNDAQRIITELSRFLEHQNVDFSKLNSDIHQLKGSSSSIGANRLKLACVNFRQASDNQNKEGCLRALNLITREYLRLRDNFQRLMELERDIQQALGTNQR